MIKNIHKVKITEATGGVEMCRQQEAFPAVSDWSV